jgi:phosphatidylglycerol---prolipoprotein diacylglyceryl transferase
VLPYVRLGPWLLPTYSLMLALAFLAGTLVYLAQAGPKPRPGTLAILAASLIGGVLGAKLPYLAGNVALFLKGVRDPEVLFAGRTVLGGLLGGTLAVMATKRVLGLRERRGDYLVPALALGLALGRIGCFLRGCCCGIPTALPWGVDFGDGVRRHPTELYECLYALLWFAFTLRRPKGERGALFDIFMASYFTFRFCLEFIRTETVLAFGLTGFQLVCVPAVAWSLWKLSASRKTPAPVPPFRYPDPIPNAHDQE